MPVIKRLRSFLAAHVRKGFEQRGFRLTRIHNNYPSETSKCRNRLAPFCIGYGVDIGFGGDPILDSAIRIDYATPYANTGTQSVQLGGDASRLHWFADNVLDYVYSSHLLEDFLDTKSVLAEWLRVLKPGGRLILFCPDQQAYEAYCREHGQLLNAHHAHTDFSLAKVRAIVGEIGATEEIHSRSLVNGYSWELVVVKRKQEAQR